MPRKISMALTAYIGMNIQTLVDAVDFFMACLCKDAEKNIILRDYVKDHKKVIESRHLANRLVDYYSSPHLHHFKERPVISMQISQSTILEIELTSLPTVSLVSHTNKDMQLIESSLQDMMPEFPLCYFLDEDYSVIYGNSPGLMIYYACIFNRSYSINQSYYFGLNFLDVHFCNVSSWLASHEKNYSISSHRTFTSSDEWKNSIFNDITCK